MIKIENNNKKKSIKIILIIMATFLDENDLATIKDLATSFCFKRAQLDPEAETQYQNIIDKINNDLDLPNFHTGNEEKKIFQSIVIIGEFNLYVSTLFDRLNKDYRKEKNEDSVKKEIKTLLEYIQRLKKRTSEHFGFLTPFFENFESIFKNYEMMNVSRFFDCRVESDSNILTRVIDYGSLNPYYKGLEKTPSGWLSNFNIIKFNEGYFFVTQSLHWLMSQFISNSPITTTIIDKKFVRKYIIDTKETLTEDIVVANGSEIARTGQIISYERCHYSLTFDPNDKTTFKTFDNNDVGMSYMDVCHLIRKILYYWGIDPNLYAISPEMTINNIFTMDYTNERRVVIIDKKLYYLTDDDKEISAKLAIEYHMSSKDRVTFAYPNYRPYYNNEPIIYL